MSKPSTAKLVAAFSAVYVIWGSTYLAIRQCVAAMPPFLMAGSRFVLAGAVLYVIARWRGSARPSSSEWLRCAAVGGLLVVGGNGLVVWSASRLPSSTVALMIAMAPLWFALLAWVFRGERPSAQALSGVVVGMAGIALLVGVGGEGGASIDGPAAVALLLASLCWAAGSVLAKTIAMPTSPLLATGMQLVAGGVLALPVALLSGEPARLDLARIGAAAWGSYAYLLVFGSLVGFTAYSWLIRVVSPTMLSTYAYVNPVVAMAVGATLGGEHISARMLAAAAVILGGVVLMATAPGATGRIERKSREIFRWRRTPQRCYTR